jgi:hypothetical protein
MVAARRTSALGIVSHFHVLAVEFGPAAMASPPRAPHPLADAAYVCRNAKVFAPAQQLTLRGVIDNP